MDKQSFALSSLAWRTSSFTVSNGNCVEVALAAAPGVAVRDTKDRDGGTARVSQAAWAAFIAAARTNCFTATRDA